MLFVRSLLYFVGQALSTVLFTTLGILMLPLPRVLRNRIMSGWARFNVWWLKVTCNIRHEIKGLENISSTPSIILSKHQSAWETVAFQAIFPAQCYVLKRELLWIPIFGWGLATTSPIAINRSAGREALKQLVTKGKTRIAQGLWIVIFPEGTRMAPGQRGKYHIGGAWLAANSGTQVIPVAHNAGTCWPKNSFTKRPGVIRVSIGAPIDTTNLKPDALNKQVEDWIEAEMLKLQ